MWVVPKMIVNETLMTEIGCLEVVKNLPLLAAQPNSKFKLNFYFFYDYYLVRI